MFLIKQMVAYEISACLVCSEICISDSSCMFGPLFGCKIEGSLSLDPDLDARSKAHVCLDHFLGARSKAHEVWATIWMQDRRLMKF